MGAGGGFGGGGMGAGRSGNAGGLGGGRQGGGAVGLGQGGLVGAGAGQFGQGQLGQGQQTGGAGPLAQQPAANPLLGGLGGGLSGGGEGAAEGMRVLPNPQNNAVVVYATAQEAGTVQAMLRRIDILPLQVRIDATIAEVTLNDNLKYGTQFLFGGGGLQGALTLAAGPARVLANPFPGFVLGDSRGTQYAIDLLQQVTQVRVLSSPQLLVLDNEPARLQVGSLVPFLTQSAQSTLAAGAPLVSSVDYRETGVIMEVIPRVSSGGLVTLDISQEVSEVDTTAPSTSGIQSPTFLERAVRSRVVVQDGQTIGLAGLIRDSDSRGNQGIPFLKDIPILGALLGSQNNTRARTELLVLITPRVVHDQRDARSLTEDMREGLANAAALPETLRRQGLSGSVDPNDRVRQRLRESLER
jgi:general secretion pathway protein D